MPLRDQLKRLALLLAPFVAVGLAYRTSPSFSLLGDAVFLISDNPLMRDLSHLPQVLASDYFASPAGESIGYWRPLTKASWLLETVIGGGSPPVYHVMQVLWLAVAASGLQLLGVMLGLSLSQATAASILFALHPAAVEPTCIVMARSDVVCTAGMVWAAGAWAGWRKTGSGGWLLAHCLFLLLALGSKEAGVIALPLFLLWSLLPDGSGEGGARRLRRGVPSAVLVLLYFLLRHRFLGQMTGADFEPDLWKILVGGGVYLKGLLPLTLASGVRNIHLAEARSAGLAAGSALAWAAAGALAGICVMKKWWDALALFAWAVGSFTLVLVVGTMRVPGGDAKIVLSDRWLMQAAASTSLFAVLLVVKLGSPGLRRFGALATLVWAAAVILSAPQAHSFYKDEIALLDAEDTGYFRTPEQYRTAQDTCRYLERVLARKAAAFDAEGSLEAYAELRAREECAGSLRPELNLLSALVARRQYARALPLASMVADDPPPKRFRLRALYLAGETFLHNGDTRRAFALLSEAAEGGLDSCGLYLALGQALSGLGRHAEAGSRLEESAECSERKGMGQRNDLLLHAAREFVEGGRTGEARRLLAELSSRSLGQREMEWLADLERSLRGEP